jgi:hypothetical protein
VVRKKDWLTSGRGLAGCGQLFESADANSVCQVCGVTTSLRFWAAQPMGWPKRKPGPIS